MPYQIGLCDDEIYQIKVNRLFLQEVSAKNGYELEYHGFQTGKQLRAYLEKQHLDILFLDIDLAEESGIEIAAWVTANFPDIAIVFVTGHREFAEEAFEVEATGYLVKPYDIKKLENVMKKVLARLQTPLTDKESFELVITDENMKKKIDVRDIMYIERQQSKSIIVTRQRSYQVYETVTSLCQRIGDAFLRINQGMVVNISMIQEIKGNVVLLKNGMEVTIGRTYRKDVINRYFGK